MFFSYFEVSRLPSSGWLLLSQSKEDISLYLLYFVLLSSSRESPAASHVYLGKSLIHFGSLLLSHRETVSTKHSTAREEEINNWKFSEPLW